mmetsp:Transcript_68085/g.109688  ORF Transcript_68085/g.109688 Transcript_68085/m.109688 type:complete len:201 (-) Transcript_68085:66-668(-)
MGNERLEDCDACTEQRRSPWQICPSWNLHPELLVDHKLVAVTAHRHVAVIWAAAAVFFRVAVGHGHAFLAVLFIALPARATFEARINKAANADVVTKFEIGYFATDSRHSADELVPRAQRVDCIPKVVVYEVDIGVANAAKLNVKGDIFVTGSVTCERYGGHVLAAGLCGSIAFDLFDLLDLFFLNRGRRRGLRRSGSRN